MTDHTEQQNKSLKATLLTTPEGRILLVGIALAFAYLSWLASMLLFSPQDSHILIGMTATETIFGRIAAMALGHSMGYGNAIVVPVCMAVETILVLLFYPLFVFSWQHVLVFNWPKNIFERTRAAAEKHKDKVQKYGIIGLFVFVWLPFWMTGPVVGCVIGFMIGLKAWTNIIAVLTGTYVAIFGWAFLLRKFQEKLAPYSSYGTLILVALVALVIIVAKLIKRNRRSNEKKPEL
jgi:uncharacterized membrane protein